MNKTFQENYQDYKGHLEIFKVFKNGRIEKVFDEANVVCSGMGATVAGAFAASSESNIFNFQINLFQVGTGGAAGLQVSSNGRLGNALTFAQYGSGFLGLVTQSLTASGTVYTNQAFAEIPQAYIDKVSSRKCRWRLILDENAGNGLGIDEVGLFSRNPEQTSPARAYLCAYRQFTELAKTNEYALHIVWTIEF
jgi:hypothetical protein